MRCSGLPTTVFPSPIAAVFTLGLIVVLAGCALKSRDIIAYHAFDYPAPAKETNPPIRGTLIVYPFIPAPSVDVDTPVISQSSGDDKSARLHRWEDKPADMITELVVRDLDSSGLFEKTVDQLSSARYRYALEGAVRNLQGIIKDGKGRALLEVEAGLTEVGREKDLIKKNYRIEVPSQDTTPDSIMKAFNVAAKEFSDRLRDDIRSAVEPKAPEQEKETPRKASRTRPGKPIKSRK